MTIQNRVNGACGGNFDRMRQAPQKTFPDLARSPVRLFPFGGNNRRLYLIRQLIGIPERPAGPVAQAIDPALLITLKDFVAGLSGNPKLPAQGSHTLPILEPNHKPHSFVHHRTFLPWHPASRPLPGPKVKPMSPERSVTYVSGRS